MYVPYREGEDNFYGYNNDLLFPGASNSAIISTFVAIDNVMEILGFTSEYIPGGNLEDYSHGPFYFRWVEQFTSAIDDLNLRHGTMEHAPRLLTHADISKETSFC